MLIKHSSSFTTKQQQKCESHYFILVFLPLETYRIIESMLRDYILSLRSYSTDLDDREIMALRDSLRILYGT